MSDKPCYLKLIVREIANTQKPQKQQNNINILRDVSIGMQLQVGESMVGSPLVALIQTAASNLIHSLSNDIGTLLLAPPSNAANGSCIPFFIAHCSNASSTLSLRFHTDSDSDEGDQETVVIDGVPRDVAWLEENAKDFSLWEKEVTANLTEEISKLDVNLWTDVTATEKGAVSVEM